MAANEHRDTKAPKNHHWTVNADGNGTSALECWWSREPLKKNKHGRVLPQEEWFIIRQENEDTHADCIMLTLGQVYDLIDAANKAIEKA